MIPNFKRVLADNALAVGASATVNGAAALKGTATDAVVSLINSAASGTVTPTIQGSNDGTTYTAVTPDKGSLTALAAGASIQTVHLAQLQYKQYRVQYVSGATSGTTASDLFDFHGVADSFELQSPT